MSNDEDGNMVMVKSKSDGEIINLKRNNSRIKITWKNLNRAIRRLDTLKKNNYNIEGINNDININDHNEFLDILRDYLDPDNPNDHIYIKFIEKNKK